MYVRIYYLYTKIISFRRTFDIMIRSPFIFALFLYSRLAGSDGQDRFVPSALAPD